MLTSTTSLPAGGNGSRPSRHRLRSTVEEFYRVEAIVPVMLSQRRDYPATVTACGGAWPADLDEGVQRFVDQSVPAP
jgi:hypothetical protein